MSKTLRPLRIFIGCPGDVAAERDVVHTVAKKLGPTAEEYGFVIQVLDWRQAVPDSGRGQAAIFKSLKPESWDIFVGILWTRFGSPSGAVNKTTGQDFESGTEEEFAVACEHAQANNGKPRIMIYQCRRAPSYDHDAGQFQKVKTFIAGIQNPKGSNSVLTLPFETKEQFEDKFLQDLQEVLRENKNNEKSEIASANHNSEERAHQFQVISNLPPRQEFFGREKELQTVRDAISKDCKEWGVFIDALGGTGKTALAIEAAHKAMDDGMFKAYVFLTAKQKRLDTSGTSGVVEEDAYVLAADDFINETARALGQQGIAQMEQRDKRKALFTALKGIPTLLIYDNLETLGEGQDAIVQFMRGLPVESKAILTSRHYSAGDGRHLPLRKLEDDAQEQIAEKEIKKDEALATKLVKHKDRWKELFKETYGSPLALLHILGLMKVRRSLNFDGAIELLKTKEGIQERIDFMFSEAKKELNDDDKTLLYALSFFRPSADINALIEVTRLEIRMLNEAIDHLGRLLLLDMTSDEDSRYTLHPLTREFVQNELLGSPNKANDSGIQFVRYWLTYAEKYGGHSKNYRTYYQLEDEWPNIDAAMAQLWNEIIFVGKAITNERPGIMLNNFARTLNQFLLYSGRWDERILISERCYVIMQILKDGDNAGWSAYDIAFTWRNRGNIQEAEKWTNKAIDAWKEEGSKNEEAIGLHMLGWLLEQKGDYPGAEKIYKKALAIQEELDNKDNVAILLCSLGQIAEFQGEDDEAERYLHNAVEKTTNFSNKAFYTCNLGVLEAGRGNWEVARKWYGEALHMSTEIGLQEIIASSCHGLAEIEETAGQYLLALGLAEKALKIREQLQDANLQWTRDLVARLKKKIVHNNR